MIWSPQTVSGIVHRQSRRCFSRRPAFQAGRGSATTKLRAPTTTGVKLSAAKIEYREQRLTLDGLQQRLDVLADVVVARAFPEIFGTLVVMFQHQVGDFFQVLQIQSHVL